VVDYRYNIHGIVTVASPVKLPELAQFRTDEPIGRPTIRVRVASLETDEDRRALASMRGIRHTCYNEGWGSLGFSAEIEIGDTVELVVSPLLRYSPHVLYTNLVEPVLRWTFVEKGYVLVHGACLAYGKHAYLVTARTDTGKTTTILKILDRQSMHEGRATFISDDLTLLSPDGQVMTYPKPLTISLHTVHAVNAPALSPWQRAALVVQSRVHSRGGRRFALLLAKTRLPMATVNAYTQWLIPPPKYPIQQLIPGTKIVREAKLAGMFVIERGGTGDVPLSNQEAVNILLQNCEDAYGFPPYKDIEAFLCKPNGHDLKAIEREIVTQALRRCPARLLRSETMDWAQRIQTVVTQPAKPITVPEPGRQPALAPDPVAINL
jgi:hypothetical protein